MFISSPDQPISKLRSTRNGVVGFATDNLDISDLCERNLAPRFRQRFSVISRRGLGEDLPGLSARRATVATASSLESIGDHLRDVTSHGCIAVVGHGLSQTTRLVEVLEIRFDLAPLGATLAFGAGVRSPCVVVPGIQSLASGLGAVPVAKT